MKKHIGVLLISLFVGACGFSRPSTFYVLDSGSLPPESVTLKNADRILIGIEPVFIPNYLDKPQIIIRQPDSVTLTASEFNRWAEQLSDVFPRVLANSISEYMGYPAAKQINLNRDLFPYRLFIEVLRFDAAFKKEAVLDTWWTIMTNSGNVVYRTRSTLVEPVGDSYDSVVLSEQKLLKELGRTIAKFAQENIKKGQK
ncbi:MAG: membrane integrity-associated transporter subunit PqiC [Alphaproteobacteria bacterium]|nr:membrane integrity-associated transporter subunit PqiC [Alphaproteobacteria bacterium]MBO4643624.1 membrane integrity-associated transporter subunit PqiC [Alphaproteobacteria bacterium]